MSERVNLPNEVPTYVFSLRWCEPPKLGAPYWIVEERRILESADTWIVIGDVEAPGMLRLNRLELDMDGMTILGDQIFYATRSRAQRFIDRWMESLV